MRPCQTPWQVHRLHRVFRDALPPPPGGVQGLPRRLGAEKPGKLILPLCAHRRGRLVRPVHQLTGRKEIPWSARLFGATSAKRALCSTGDYRAAPFRFISVTPFAGDATSVDVLQFSSSSSRSSSSLALMQQYHTPTWGCQPLEEELVPKIQDIGHLV